MPGRIFILIPLHNNHCCTQVASLRVERHTSYHSLDPLISPFYSQFCLLEHNHKGTNTAHEENSGKIPQTSAFDACVEKKPWPIFYLATPTTAVSGSQSSVC